MLRKWRAFAPLHFCLAACIHGAVIFLSYSTLGVAFAEQLQEPPEIVGLNNKVTELTKEQKAMYTDLNDTFGIIGHEKDPDKLKPAIEKLDKILEENPEYSDGYFMRAMANYLFLRSKNYPMIIADIDKAISLHSSSKYDGAFKTTASHFSLRAKVLKESGNFERAMDDLEKAINIDIHDAIPPSGTTPNEEPEAGAWGQKDFDEIISIYPNDYKGYLFRGLFYYNYRLMLNGVPQGYEHAIADVTKAISLNHSSPMSYYILGSILDQKLAFGRKSDEDYRKEAKFTLNGQSIWNAYPEECSKIIEAYTAAIKIDPKMIEAYQKRAEINLETQQYELAIQDYDKIIELCPVEGGTYNDRGLANMKLARYYRAISDFSAAIDIKEKKSDDFHWLYSSYSNRASANSIAGNYENAINDYTKAIQLYLADNIILMNVSQFRAIYPEYNSVSDDILAKLLWKKTFPNWKYEDFAKQFLKKDIHYSTIMPELYVKRGDTYLICGDWRKAILDYNRAAKGFPSYEEAIDRWRPLTKDKETISPIYLDFKTIEKSGTHIVKFWIKSNNKNSQEFLENCEINCSSKQMHVLEFLLYDENGDAVQRTGTTRWQSIIPDSFGEVLYNHLCKSGALQ